MREYVLSVLKQEKEEDRTRAQAKAIATTGTSAIGMKIVKRVNKAVRSKLGTPRLRKSRKDKSTQP